MKLQYKAAGLMAILSTIVLSFMTIFYSNYISRLVLHKELQNIRNLSEEIADHMNSHLKQAVSLSTTLSSAPIIRDKLLISNSEYAFLSFEEQKDKIEMRNRQWMEAEDISDPFIQEHLTNPVAEFLKLQQIIMPDFYGEIFLTNHYGEMIASTGKLTTLAHAHKYWWKASYHEGKGRVFFDDRGFDESVDDYVLGVVFPIKNDEEIIGILKCNINLEGPLTEMIQYFDLRNTGKLQIVRTKGLILAEKDKIPLSDTLPEELVHYIQKNEDGAFIVENYGKKELMAYSSIPLTMGSDEYGFGGSYESIDHIKGNEGEGWHIVVTLDKNIALIDAHRTTRILLISGLIFILITSIISLLFGKWLTKPLVMLSKIAQKIGEGNLKTRIRTITNDEVGILSTAVNDMAENLEETLTSKDNLSKEIEIRKSAEKQLKISLREKEIILKEVHHRIKNNFASIGSLLYLHTQSTTNPEVKYALQDAIGRVDSMQVLYEKLLLTDDYMVTSIKDYLVYLIDDIITLFSKDMDIAVEKQIDDFQLDTKRLVPVGIIVNELLTNIMKYAFTDRASGSIEIIVKENKGKVSLTIQDNGKQLPESFDISESKGFGLMLIRMLSEQLNGSFTIKNNNGTKSTLEFNI